MTTRGSWRYNEETGELEAQPRADYPTEAEEQRRRELREVEQEERDRRGGQYV